MSSIQHAITSPLILHRQISLNNSGSNANSNANSNPTAAPLPPLYRAPAHKHAHHLHSIPPREKSTRTLILDHLLWVHSRTRFAQARAELGMTDRTGGPTSSHYAKRERPEEYDEDLMVDSDGEEVEVLKGQTGLPRGDGDFFDPNGAGAGEDIYEGRQDLNLAKALRLRAEGLEKVIVSMLDQPPAVLPNRQDHDILATPPTSPRLHPQGSSAEHPKLPNGVRLRLALATLLNDLFVRRAPPPPFRHRGAMSEDVSTPSSVSTVFRGGPNALPPEVLQLAKVSASGVNESPSSAQRAQPAPRTLAFYDAGADPSTANSPPDLRCPRHLHTGCEICVPAKAPLPSRSKSKANTTSSSGGGAHGHHPSSSPSSSRTTRGVTPAGTPATAAPGANPTSGAGGGGITGWQTGPGVGSGLSLSPFPSTSMGPKPGSTTSKSKNPSCVSGGSVLRRQSLIPEIRNSERGRASFTNLTELVPRFIRLSALVAMEVGMEVKDASDGHSQDELHSNSNSHSHHADTDGGAGEDSDSNADGSPYAYTLKPTREWYMLLAGLLTRCVLEGYLTASWRGSLVLRCVLGVGLDGAAPSRSNSHSSGQRNEQGAGHHSYEHRRDDDDEDDEDDEDEFAEFDPDELPSMTDAVRMLFPSLREDGSNKTNAEAEYGMEMEARLRKFYDIPSSTPDLSTHMEDVAWLFPAEPVERAATRFCEAIARWRGKPELETHHKRAQSTDPTTSSTSNTEGGMSIENLIEDSPRPSNATLTPGTAATSPNTTTAGGSTPANAPGSSTSPSEGGSKKTPGIERYFTLTGSPGHEHHNGVGGANGKRGRSESDALGGGRERARQRV